MKVREKKKRKSIVKVKVNARDKRTNSGEIREEEKMLKELEWEDPFLGVGTPPCNFMSQILNIMKNKMAPQRREELRATGRRYLQTACAAYMSQIRRGKYFLHEHPWGAESWQEDCVREVAAQPGVRIVKGPQCKYHLQGYDRYGNHGFIRKYTGFITNLPELAD